MALADVDGYLSPFGALLPGSQLEVVDRSAQRLVVVVPGGTETDAAMRRCMAAARIATLTVWRDGDIMLGHHRE